VEIYHKKISGFGESLESLTSSEIARQLKDTLPAGLSVRPVYGERYVIVFGDDQQAVADFTGKIPSKNYLGWSATYVPGLGESVQKEPRKECKRILDQLRFDERAIDAGITAALTESVKEHRMKTFGELLAEESLEDLWLDTQPSDGTGYGMGYGQQRRYRNRFKHGSVFIERARKAGHSNAEIRDALTKMSPLRPEEITSLLGESGE